MRVRAFAIRILRQMSHDKRTLALMIFVPLILLTLVYYIFEGTDSKIDIGTVGIPQQISSMIEKESDAKINSYDTREDAQEALEKGKIVAYMDLSTKVSGDKAQAYIMLDAAAGSKSKAAEKLLMNVADSAANVVGEAPPVRVLSNLIDIKIEYYKGVKDFTSFDMFGPTLMSFIVFFFVFLVAGMAFLKERKSGTLEKVMSTPVRRWEIVVGYILGFGVITIIQSVVINVFIIKALGVIMHGSLWYVLLITLLEAVCALSLGMLLSTAAGSEFQMMQFIPIIIIPQLFFSGLFDLSKGWLIFGRIFPLTYAAEAMNKIMYYGSGIPDFWIDIAALLGFSALFAGLNILLLKRYRRI